MDCRRFSQQMMKIKNLAARADSAIARGDSKTASEILEQVEAKVREARENLGRVGA